jgi:citrate synthase
MSWLTAIEALQVLKVRPQTLYANVSRKKIRAKPDPKDTRRSLYHAADVRKMARQHGGQRKAAAIAAEAIQWGDPILSSAVSTVAEGKLYYRGQDAAVLAQDRSLEEVAELLWGVATAGEPGRDGPVSGVDAAGPNSRGGSVVVSTGHDPRRGNGGVGVGESLRRGNGGVGVGESLRQGNGGVGVGQDSRRGNGVNAAHEARRRSAFAREGWTRTPALCDLVGPRVYSSTPPLQRAFLALGLRAAADFASYGRSLSVLQNDAASLLVTLADAMLGEQAAAPAHTRGRHGGRARRSSSWGGGTPPLHELVASRWRRRDAADIIRRALVLLADHELNASTFATRVAVSTGAPLAAGVLSGLSALSGPLHGRASVGVLQLVTGVARVGADATVREWLSLGRHISGFGHPLYPLGDPRAQALMQQFELPKEYAELRAIVEREIGEQPNVDFALSALTQVYGLPREAPLILFALGRCAGWLAHALEQVTTGRPIRPRAHYVGPPPAS